MSGLSDGFIGADPSEWTWQVDLLIKFSLFPGLKLF